MLTGQYTAKFNAALAANPELAQLLAAPGAQGDTASAFSKLQKQGAVGLKDAAVLSQYADSFLSQKQQKQEAALKAQQLQQQQFILQEAQSKKAEEDAMNAKLAQMARIGSQLKGGVGAGVMAPQAATDARDFAGSPVGQMVSMGARVTPEMVAKMQELKMGNDARMQEAKMAADSRGEVAGIRAQSALDAAGLRAQLGEAQATAKAATQSNKDSATAFDETKKLRDEFSAHPNTKQFDVVDKYYKSGVKFAEKGTSAGDMGLIFALMKVYDPTSTVREGEYATASNSGSIPERFMNIYNKMKDGEKLQPAQRQDFLDTMKQAAQTQHSQLLNTASQYNRIASKRGLDPTEVVDPTYMSWNPDAQTAPSGQPQIAAPATTGGAAASILAKYGIK